jgi:hypothetical protein
MYTRKLIDFFFAKPPQTKPFTKAGTSPKGEFAWPPSDEDMKAFSVVHLRVDDGSPVPDRTSTPQ